MTTATQIPTDKLCRACNETKPLDAFYGDRTAKDGRGSKCRECWRSGARPAPRPRPEPRPAREEPLASFEPGRTCINCGEHRDSFPAEQLPRTSPRYPLCATCLRHARRIEGARFGIEE